MIDRLETLVPMLVRKYGDIAATAADAWYDEARKDTLGEVDGFHASLEGVQDFPSAAIQDSIGWRAGIMDREGLELDAMATFLRDGVDRWVRYSGQEALRVNTARDPRAHGYALVPVGKTCAFCCMLASRGFAYTSRDSADRSRHAHCDCQVVPGWGSPGARRAIVRGYDPDRYLGMYENAKSKLEKISRVEAKGRRLAHDDEDADLEKSLRQDMGEWWGRDVSKMGHAMQPAGYRPGMTLNAYLREHDGYELADPRMRQRAILSLMRRNDADDLTDGVHVGFRHVDQSLQVGHWQDYRASLATRFLEGDHREWRMPPIEPVVVPEDWPKDIPAPNAASWNHILYGSMDSEKANGVKRLSYEGAHLHGYGWIEDKKYGNTEFPSDWSPDDVEQAVISILQNGEKLSDVTYTGTYRNVRIKVTLRSDAGKMIVSSAFPLRR